MIEQLTYAVRFPPTDHYPLGRAFDRTLTFQKGMTNIVGPNETGKTFCLEMIEFLLFGSSALRGKADDYKHLKASGLVMIRGIRYAIERTHKNAVLAYGEGSMIAVGTKPVNQRIMSLLGYGLDVFRVSNVANQGDAERLSKMKPTERKAMVDRLIGADQIEAMAKWCGEEALGVSREIAGLETGLSEPVAPVQPEGYRPVAELGAEIAALRADNDRAVELRAFLANEPVVPVLGEEPTNIPLATLEKAEQVLQLRTYDFDLEVATQEHAAYQLYDDLVSFRIRHPKPKLDRQTVEEQNTAADVLRDLGRLAKSPIVTCPCGKPFTTADAEIARLEAELRKIPVLKGVYDLGQEARRLDDWDLIATKTEWERVKGAVEVPEPEHDPRDAKGAVHVDEVRKALAELGVTTHSLPEVRALASKLRAWMAQRDATELAMASKAAWDLQAGSARTALAAIDTSALPALVELLTQCQVYDAQAVAYEAARASYDIKIERLTALRTELQSWRNGKQAMNDLRDDTKNYLVPALSRVASYMISQMTGGARTRIVVDEDFEIQVDGQPLNTLSGSGKVCANLAIRLGLGRILTNGVFPVFMGDEMDASMDDDRAAHLHDALVALQDKLTQIVIITHKAPTCAQVIKLEH